MNNHRCEMAREAWLLDGDGVLSWRRRAALRHHLDGCSACRAWTASGHHWCVLAQSTTPDIPLSAAARAVIRSVAIRRRGRQWRSGPVQPFSLPALAAALMVFACLTAWMLLRPTSPVARVVRSTPEWPVRGEFAAAVQVSALAYLLQSDESDEYGAVMLSAPADADALESLKEWILREQAQETLEYLEDRLAFAS